MSKTSSKEYWVNYGNTKEKLKKEEADRFAKAITFILAENEQLTKKVKQLTEALEVIANDVKCLHYVRARKSSGV